MSKIATPGTDSAESTPGLELSLADFQSRIRGFLREYLQNKSPETVGTYRRSLNEFERWFVRQGGKCRFRTEDVAAYKDYLMTERELHQVSVSTYLTAVRRFCQYLVDVGLLEANPALAVSGNRRPGTHSRKVLDEEDVEQLLTSFPMLSKIDLRDRAVVHMMLFAGLSEIEIVRADVSDLEQTLMGWFLRTQGKGHTVKDQEVQIEPPVMDAIRLYLDARGRIHPEEPLFVSHGHRSEGQRLNTRSVRGRINYHLKRAGIKKPGISPHSLTHTAALIWLGDGMPVDEVRERMRHGTLDTTMIYFKAQKLNARSNGGKE